MSLKDCPECGQSVSGAAVTCPGCGHPLKKPKQALVSRPLGLILQLIGACMIFWGITLFMGPVTGGKIAGLFGGFFLVYVGGRTKARL